MLSMRFLILMSISFRPLYLLKKYAKKAIYGNDRRSLIFFSALLSFFIFLLDASLVDLLLRLASDFPLCFSRFISSFSLLIFALKSAVIVMEIQMINLLNFFKFEH